MVRIHGGRPLSRGLGRSYGDSSLPAANDREVVSTVLADRILSFDADRGLLRAEAGLSLDAIYPLFLPRSLVAELAPRGASRWMGSPGCSCRAAGSYRSRPEPSSSRWAGWWRRTSTARTTTRAAASAPTSWTSRCASPTDAPCAAAR